MISGERLPSNSLGLWIADRPRSWYAVGMTTSRDEVDRTGLDRLAGRRGLGGNSSD